MSLNRFLPWIGFLIIAGTVLAGAASGQFLKPLGLLFAAGILVMLIGRPQWLLVITVVLMPSGLVLPFLPGSSGVYMLFGALGIVSIVIGDLSRGGGGMTREDRRLLFWISGFIAVLVVTAAFRGSGLRMLGSEKWGGRPYVLLIFAASLLIASFHVLLTPALCRRMIYGFCLAGLMPTLAALLAHYLGIEVLGQFFGGGDETTQILSSLAGADDPMFRLQIANVGSTYMFLLMWVVLQKGGVSGRVLMIACGLAGIVLTGISGHRISLLYGVVLSVAFVFLNVRVPVFRRLVNGYSLVLALILVMLVLFAHHLPYTFQRSLTWLPFVNVSAGAHFDSEVTSAWRMELWKRALEEAPDYLLLGKGFAFSSGEMLSFVRWTMNDYDFVLTSRNYHNGVIQLLLDLGLPGLFFAVGLVFVVLRKHYRYLSESWCLPWMNHLHRVMLAGFAAQVIVYVFVGGGATSFVDLFFWILILEQVRKVDQDEASRMNLASPAGGGT